MVKTVTSFSNKSTSYRLTVDEHSGRAIMCDCKDFQYRGNRDNHQCKHMVEFGIALERAAAFILIERRIREVEESARINRERAAMHAIFNPDNL